MKKVMAKQKEDVYRLALERLRVAFKQFDTVAVSFSGGKDNTVCLQLTLQVAKEIGWKRKIPVFFYDEEAIPYQTEHYVRRIAKQYKAEMDFHWLCLPVKHRNACSRSSPFWYPWAPEDRERWVRPLPPEAITSWPGFPTDPKKRFSLADFTGLLLDPLKFGSVALVLGIRTQESITRMRSIFGGIKGNKTREKHYIIRYATLEPISRLKRQLDRPYRKYLLQESHIWKIYPIYDWTTEDVWTAPHQFGWDYNSAYDVMDKMGVTPLAQRCAPPYGEEPMQSLGNFRAAFPDIWDKMQRRVPGANTAAMYSRTELYGFQSWPTKLEGKTWKETISHYVGKHPEAERGHVIDMLKGWIDLHYKRTKDPILGYACHPVTGISWSWLAMLASRGDFKRRKVPKTMYISDKDDPKYQGIRDAYQKELATWTEGK